MRTAHQCLAKADQCETMAGATLDPSSRRVLRETAKHWRTLARAAAAQEVAEPAMLVAQRPE